MGMKAMNFSVGNTKIIILGNEPNEKNIRELYDFCNDKFSGITDCFYTKEEVENLNLASKEK